MNDGIHPLLHYSTDPLVLDRHEVLRAWVQNMFAKLPAVPSAPSRKQWAIFHGLTAQIVNNWYDKLKMKRVLKPGMSGHPLDGFAMDPYYPLFGLEVPMPPRMAFPGPPAPGPSFPEPALGPCAPFAAPATAPDFVVAAPAPYSFPAVAAPGPSSSPVSADSPLLQTPLNFNFDASLSSSSPVSADSPLLQMPPNFNFDASLSMNAPLFGPTAHEASQSFSPAWPLPVPPPGAPPAPATVASASKGKAVGKAKAPAASTHSMKTRGKRKAPTNEESPSVKRIKTLAPNEATTSATVLEGTTSPVFVPSYLANNNRDGSAFPSGVGIPYASVPYAPMTYQSAPNNPAPTDAFPANGFVNLYYPQQPQPAGQFFPSL